MQHQLALPALRSDSPLGFLAALGTLEIVTHTLDAAARLSWNGPAQPANLHTTTPLTLPDLANHLHQQLPHFAAKKSGKKQKGEQKPVVEPEPLLLAPGLFDRERSPGAPNETLRMPPAAAHKELRRHATAERETGAPQARWFAALINQLHTEEKRGGHYTSITPFFSPAGQMTLRQNWLRAVEECHNHPQQLTAALTSWVRVEKYAGASLDYHSSLPAAAQSDGNGVQHGVPGATWLALHAFAHYRLTGNGQRPRTTGWHRTTTFTWPIWHPPLTTTAITTLLEHPLIHDPRNPTHLANLGIMAVYTTRRTSLNSAAGPLATAHRTWPPATSEPQARQKSPHRTEAK
ncbi:type I-G CRISPR-associated protein, Cas3-extension family [Streptomyces xiamenensis]